MSRERLSLGTAFIQALLNSYDEYHQLGQAALPPRSLCRRSLARRGHSDGGW
jgi:hypothetical protein